MRLKVKSTKKIRQSDFFITALVTMLVVFGVVMVFSASYYKSINASGSPYGYLTSQGVNAIIGFGIMYVCSLIPYKLYYRYHKLIMFIAIGLLVAVLSPLGSAAGGATRALYFGVTIMPGELAKPAVIIFTASFLAKDKEKILSLKRGVGPLLLLMGVLAGLIMKQPNLSTAITICGIMAGIMFLAGLEWKWVIGAAGFGGIGFSVLAFLGDKIGMDHWHDRIVSFMDPFADALGDGFQVVQGLLALGSGGLFGLGLGNSIQKNLYLPEPQNDFILAIIGEELGFIGLLILLAVYLVLIWRCFHVCINAPDRFSMLLCGGITIMIGLQVILNVAVVTSSMPPTGVSLPFISYGGNSLWIFMACAGIVLNISRFSSGAVIEERKQVAR